jgi:predicted homoserine dehydrogenase-like protein
MIIIDKLLQKREQEGKPIRVAMVGSGFMGRAIAWQICNVVHGMELVAISARKLESAKRAYNEAGVNDISKATSLGELNGSLERDRFTISDDPLLLCKADKVDAILEVTGSIEFAAGIALEAIKNGKHVILMNAELDGTLGPILKIYADRNDVIITNVDGDQPGVILNLYRFLKGIGLKPVLCGNIKGLHDPYRNPTTQEGFAQQWKQKPHMVTSFADGTKISFEQAIVANATGMRIAKRGMIGVRVKPGTSIQEAIKLFPLDEIAKGAGIVDYVVGAEPGPGVFVIGKLEDPIQKTYLNYYKLGEGPFYCLYTPYHLCHFEVPNTIARAVMLKDATIAPLGKPFVDVVTTAKKDLNAGEVLDGIGQYMTYGQCENSDLALKNNLLPIGIAEGCRLKRDIPKDQVLSYDDVELPRGRLCDRLRAEQSQYFYDAHNE